jgi:hypothetical protein
MIVARQTERLSDLAVRRSKKPGFYPDGRQLYLQVSPTGSKSWLFRFARQGRERWMGLGPYPDVSLAEARQKAFDARRLLRDGIDPIEARRTARSAARLEEARGLAFKDCAERYIAAHEAGWRNAKHRAQWRSTRRRHRHRTRHENPRADLAGQARDSRPGARAHRGGLGLGCGPTLSHRRQSSALARPPGQAPTVAPSARSGQAPWSSCATRRVSAPGPLSSPS